MTLLLFSLSLSKGCKEENDVDDNDDEGGDDDGGKKGSNEKPDDDEEEEEEGLLWCVGPWAKRRRTGRPLPRYRGR